MEEVIEEKKSTRLVGGGTEPGKKKEKSAMNVSAKSFIAVMAILLGMIIVAGVLTYIIPQGRFLRDESGKIIADSFEQGPIKGLPVWRFFTAPAEVFWSEDAINVIMVSLFLLILSGTFNIMSKTGGIKAVVGVLAGKFSKKKILLVLIVCLLFMVCGSFFGMFEELVALMPVIIVLSLSLGYDTLTGMSMCMLGSCFGFCAAVINPFSVGVASGLFEISILSGVWLRVILFAVVFAVLALFIFPHTRRIGANPKKSLTFALDETKRANLPDENPKIEQNKKAVRTYAVFFLSLLLLILSTALIPVLSGLSVPILAVGFLVGGMVCGLILTKSPKDTFLWFGKGALGMLPAVVMIAFASSVKLIMTNGGILDTVIHTAIGFLSGHSPYVAVLLIFALVLFLQIFIGSASAKAMLIIPILAPICASVGISYNIAILAFILADGFTNVLFPTNAVLLVGLSMAQVSYGKWFRFTALLQLAMLVLSVGALMFGVAIHY